jgi:TPR repeat protein
VHEEILQNGYGRIDCQEGARGFPAGRSTFGDTIAESNPMTLFWKNVVPILCGAAICAAAITWQVHKAKVNEWKLAENTRELTEAARVCLARSEQGDAKAESELAYMYSHGEGVPQDYSEALRWRHKAADQGYAAGEAGLGYMYLHGQGVAQAYAEALRWYRKAADQGDANAQTTLGFMYEQGQGVSQDYSEGLRWYQRAAERGYAPAQYSLGEMYYYGRGVPQDHSEAVRWYRKAADQGDEYAQRVLHIKWKGLGTFSKITISIILLGGSFSLVSSLIPGGSLRNSQQRTFTLVGLLGLSYAAVDLYGFRYIGLFTPVLAVGAFQFLRSLVAGTSVALLLSVVLPSKICRKIAKIGIGVFGILLLGQNFYAIAIPRLRSVVTALRSFWSINGTLLGMLGSVAIYLWFIHKKAEGSAGPDGEDSVSNLGNT